MKKIQDKNYSGIYYYTLKNKNAVSVTVTNYGATITSIMAPDRNGDIDEITLTYDDVSGFKNGRAYFGATIGRFANRINGGRFMLGGSEYKLFCNDSGNHLHGGKIGFDKVVWKEAKVSDSGVSLEYLSPDGEEGYPGSLKTTVEFSLDDDNNFCILYKAKSDKDTIISLTNHAYFNLAGHKSGSIEGHVLYINADSFNPVDAKGSATGETKSVDGTPFDFRRPTAIGERMHEDDEQLQSGHGYDHNYVLGNAGYGLAAKVTEPKSGRSLEVYTDMPCVQLYCANFLKGEKGKDGAVYNIHDALCLETQFAPDSPNQPAFASPVLKKGELYERRTCYKLGIV